MAGTFTELASRTIVSNRTVTYHETRPTRRIVVEEMVYIDVLVEIPLACDNLHAYYASHGSDNDYQTGLHGDITPNPDIAGIGVCRASSILSKPKV